VFFVHKGVDDLKKLVFLLAIVAMFVLMGGVALAETPHGPFDDNTALCAACHRTHTAQDDYLLSQAEVTFVCTACHSAGQGADTDVVNGVYITGTGVGSHYPGSVAHDAWGVNGRALMGGGFMNVQGAGTPTTSKHFNTTSRGLTYKVTFGHDDAPGATFTGIAGEDDHMDCVDCHLPHRSTNYRMLRTKPNGVHDAIVVKHNITDPAGTSPSGGHKYTDNEGQFNLQAPAAGTNDGISAWCGACHDYYYNNSSAGPNGGDARETPFSATYYDINGDTTADLTYMHAVDADLLYTARNGGNDSDNLAANLSTGSNANVLPVAGANSAYDATDVITCLTCHRSHGSEYVNTGYATGASVTRTLSGKTIPGSDSNLLRLKNRGVCETCHNMPQGIQGVPTP